jgi:ATP-dependent exoDNAse (exonuclease V) beta subunit
MPKEPIRRVRPALGHKPRFITGHVDFLQVRDSAIHILDYKPDARTNKPISQLAIYALALTRLYSPRLLLPTRTEKRFLGDDF